MSDFKLKSKVFVFDPKSHKIIQTKITKINKTTDGSAYKYEVEGSKKEFWYNEVFRTKLDCARYCYHKCFDKYDAAKRALNFAQSEFDMAEYELTIAKERLDNIE